jgi:predicted Zn finger-like uncharacterized protein
MLFTRCPDCGTTFRVTDDALTKANGQVRCGRCTRVFNAYDERRDAPIELASSDSSASRELARAPPPASAPPPAPAAPKDPVVAREIAPAPDGRGAAGQAATARGSAASPTAQAATSVRTPPAGEPAGRPREAQAASPSSPASAVKRDSRGHTSVTQPITPPRERAVPTAPMQGTDHGSALAYDTDDPRSMSVADVVAEVELSTTAYSVSDDVEARTDVGEIADVPMSPSQVDRVLETNELSVWLLGQELPTRRTTWWAIGTTAAVLVLVLQAVHHYRADLVNTRFVGPIVTDAYAMLGMRVTPRWDIRQYEIVDWVATAEPSTRGQGTLKITAHIKNRGPQRQPYPSVQLELKDRWETAVGSRVFAPRDYLTAPPRDLMAPGETARAEIEVVDPGRDAYGFELDVCIEVETDQLSCRNDKVFL